MGSATKIQDGGLASFRGGGGGVDSLDNFRLPVRPFTGGEASVFRDANASAWKPHRMTLSWAFSKGLHKFEGKITAREPLNRWFLISMFRCPDFNSQHAGQGILEVEVHTSESC